MQESPAGRGFLQAGRGVPVRSRQRLTCLVVRVVFRGLLDAGASQVTTDMLLRAAQAIADTVSAEELHAAFIIPSVFHPDVTKRVASAISGKEG